jgi:pimeloyl-ACP methyl ester carboxylesterase
MTAPYPAGPVASGVVHVGRRPRRLVLSVAAVAVASLAAAACGTNATGSQRRPPARRTASTGPSGYQCATLRVPLDWADPAKGTIGLALDRRPASGHALGSLVENPGGPGVSGVDYLPTFVAELPGAVTSRFDVVGFDPPGAGRSHPITCGTPSALTAELSVDPSPDTKAGFDALVAADRRFAAGCEARSGRILPYVSTVDAARDLDMIRAAVGDAGLTYVGFSYGTLLGATYAELYPTRVRAMVLDGAIDPALGPVRTVDQQSAALEKQLDAFLGSCAAGGCGWHPPGDLAKDFRRLLADVSAHPVPVPGTGQSVGPAALLYGSAAALYSPRTWPVLGQALTGLGGGHGRDILELFDSYIGRSPDGSFANTVEAESAVDCLDAPAPSLASLRADAGAAARGAPVFGLLDLYSEATCSVWPVTSKANVGPLHAVGSPPIVVVGTTHDPITPYAWAQALASQLAHGVLLTRDGYGHTGYAYSACIRSAVDRYLLTLRVPRRGTTCQSS